MSTSINSLIEKAIPFVERAGLKVILLKPGNATCEMPLTPNVNHVGGMYAGAQFTLADICGGALLLASFDKDNYYPTLKNLSLNFMKPATSDLRLTLQLSSEKIVTMEQELAQVGRAYCRLEGDLLDLDNKVVAQMEGDFVLLSHE